MANIGWDYLTDDDKDAILRGIRDGRAYGGPYHVELHPADRCNVECFFCSTAPLREKDQIEETRLDEVFCELKELGTRSVRLAGGGEPLFHRGTKKYLASLAHHGLRVENLTTNAVLLDDGVAEHLVRACDDVTISINTADGESYAKMMKTPARNFERVVANVRRLIAMRGRARLPRVTFQYLVWKENFRSIPRMYDLARELGADEILFSGISHLRAEDLMTPEETRAMIDLYERVVRVDEYRTIRAIASYEQDLSASVYEMNLRLHEERSKQGALRRAWRYVRDEKFTLGQRLRHTLRMRHLRRTSAAAESLPEECVIGWHSLVIRATGTVAPCCMMQANNFGNIYKNSVRDIWYGERFERLRVELRDIAMSSDDWRYDPARHREVLPKCGGSGFGACPIRSDYYRADVPFMQKFGQVASR